MAKANGNNKRRWGVGSIILLCISGVLFLAGAALIVRQFVYIPSEYVEPPVSTFTPLPTALPSAPTTPQPGQTQAAALEPAEPTPTPYELRTPVMLYFPDRKINCEIQPVGSIEDGEKAGKMDTVDSATIAAWYQYGPSPGDNGNALINGHVRWNGKAGTFSILPDMEIGERIIIEYDNGSTNEFFVDSIEYHPYYNVPDSVMDLDVGGEPRVTLISCHGDFDHGAGTSSERVIVVCKPPAGPAGGG